jgi:membrane protease subunit HflK
MFTGIYQVNEQERAVVLRFGTFHRYEEPGFKIRLPSPIERHRSCRVNTEIRTEIGGSNDANLMLTGDENIIDIDFVINWRVFEPRDYLFNVVDVQDGDPTTTLIEQIGESAMREVVGTSAFEPITTTGRSGVETRVRDADAADAQFLQRRHRDHLDLAAPACRRLKKSSSVQREVSSAEQDKAKREAEAIAYRNKVVPEAQGQAERRDHRSRRLQGRLRRHLRAVKLIASTSSTNSIARPPRVTRERMYLETMEKVIGRTNQIILDGKSGAIPILPLDQMLRGRQAPPQGQ